MNTVQQLFNSSASASALAAQTARPRANHHHYSSYDRICCYCNEQEGPSVSRYRTARHDASLVLCNACYWYAYRHNGAARPAELVNRYKTKLHSPQGIIKKPFGSPRSPSSLAGETSPYQPRFTIKIPSPRVQDYIEQDDEDAIAALILVSLSDQRRKHIL